MPRRKALGEQTFARFQQRRQNTFCIDRAASPDAAVEHLAAKRRMPPLFRVRRDDVVMAHEHDGALAVRPLPAAQNAVFVDGLHLEIVEHARIQPPQQRQKRVERRAVHFAVARPDGRKPDRFRETPHRAFFVERGRVRFMRRRLLRFQARGAHKQHRDECAYRRQKDKQNDPHFTTPLSRVL